MASIPDTGGKPAFKERRIIFVLTLAIFIEASDFLLVGPLLPDMMASIGVPASQGGFLVSIQALCGGLVVLFSGPISDRKGKKTVVVLAFAMVAIGIMGFATQTYSLVFATAMLLFWTLFFGIGEAPLITLISELNPQSRGTVLSLNSACVFGGIAAITAISSVLLDYGGFLAVGIMCSMATLTAMVLIRVFVRQ